MATIKAISGRVLTVETEEGSSADYRIAQRADVTLNGEKTTLAELDNGDEIELGGITPTEVKQVRATRGGADPKTPPSRKPNQHTTHFPPEEGEVSNRMAQKERQTATLPNPEARQEVDKKIKHSDEVRKDKEEEELEETLGKQQGLKPNEDEGEEEEIDLNQVGTNTSTHTDEDNNNEMEKNAAAQEHHAPTLPKAEPLAPVDPATPPTPTRSKRRHTN